MFFPRKLSLILLIILTFCIKSVSFAEQLIIEPEAGRAPILSAIQQAKSSVYLSMYGLTDMEFVDKLISAKNAGKEVKIILEPQPYKSENENQQAIKKLRFSGLALRKPDPSFNFLHQKTFLFDRKNAMIMTFNLTHSTFKNERNFALVTSDPKIVKEIQQVFSADWAHKKIIPENSNLVWSPENSREKILRFIEQARSEIKVYAQDINDFQILGALAKAARSGVQVKIILSANLEKFYSNKFKYLKRAGVQLRNSGIYRIHAKVMIVDHARALIGSTNLTTTSLENNRELSIITQNSNVIAELIQTFDSDWRNSEPVLKYYLRQGSLASKKILNEYKHLWRIA